MGRVLYIHTMKRTYSCQYCVFISERHDDMFGHWHEHHAGKAPNAKGEWGPPMWEYVQGEPGPP